MEASGETLMKCKICNSLYHETNTEGINQLDILKCIAKNMTDILVTLEVK